MSTLARTKLAGERWAPALRRQILPAGYRRHPAPPLVSEGRRVAGGYLGSDDSPAVATRAIRDVISNAHDG